ncbi:hypothetical protein [Nostocoides jenkinsii]|uniref:hypothetical protein n=1 Tax=Nostocoides jenkinsii TaxID=330834 RepID=UPI0012EDB8C5|nr:hypothetical protein [Tetrasphaera jenkinsii]
MGLDELGDGLVDAEEADDDALLADVVDVVGASLPLHPTRRAPPKASAVATAAGRARPARGIRTIGILPMIAGSRARAHN